MHSLLLQAQAWWDAQRFDQPVWQLTAWRDQKVRHIQLHVAKALGKVVAACGDDAAAPARARLASVRDEVLPDVAIYRSQLLNAFPDWCARPASLCSPDTGVAVECAAPLLRVVLLLSRASARLASYLEPREHGVASSAALIGEAVQALHASAELLAAYFSVDLASAHQARLEALLGAPLPSALLEGDVAER